MTLDELIWKMQNLRVNAGRGDLVVLDGEGWSIEGASLVTLEDERQASEWNMAVGDVYVEVRNPK